MELIPFAGIAFLWFMGAVRDRIGAAEDRFFATVYLGSGLLFTAITTSTIGLRLRILPTWLAGIGYVVALVLLFVIKSVPTIELAFPVWILLVSVYMLVAGRRPAAATGSSDQDDDLADAAADNATRDE